MGFIEEEPAVELLEEDWKELGWGTMGMEAMRGVL